jgi:DNA-binding NarL/FixJ family response regulator
MDIEQLLSVRELNQPEELTVLVVGTQPIFRQGLKQSLSSYQDIKVVGECGSNIDVLPMLESLLPDIVLVDIGTRIFGNFGLVRQMSLSFPKVAVVILSPDPGDDGLFQAIKSGAVAYLSKDVPPDELVAILRQVAQGEYPINDSLLARPNAARKMLRVFRRFALKDMGSFMTPLSHREMEVLKYIAEGNANKRIANTLNTSEQTIKNHVTSIMRKLHANDRTPAVVLAIRQGWLDVGEATEVSEKELVYPR